MQPQNNKTWMKKKAGKKEEKKRKKLTPVATKHLYNSTSYGEIVQGVNY